MNRKKAAKKKSPTPLTADMLNELNKNHMGGLENYGAEDLYNLEDTWDDRRQDLKPKVKASTLKFKFDPKFNSLFAFFSSASQLPITEVIPTSMIVGAHNTFSNIKRKTIIMIPMIHLTIFSQSISSNSHHNNNKIYTAAQSGSWSPVGTIAHIHLTMEVVTIIVHLED